MVLGLDVLVDVGCVVSCEESEWFGIGEMFSLDDRREGE